MRKPRQRPFPFKQPDFQGLFFDFFGPVPKRHRYGLRFKTSNLHHDLIFLTSLLHDARLTLGSVRVRGSNVVINMERDTWEVGFLVREGAPTLHYCRTRLSVGGVRESEWRFRSQPPPRDAELWLDKLDLQPSRENCEWFDLRLLGEGWEYHLVLVEEEAAVLLRDLARPISHETQQRAGA